MAGVSPNSNPNPKFCKSIGKYKLILKKSQMRRGVSEKRCQEKGCWMTFEVREANSQLVGWS